MVLLEPLLLSLTKLLVLALVLRCFPLPTPPQVTTTAATAPAATRRPSSTALVAQAAAPWQSPPTAAGCAPASTACVC